MALVGGFLGACSEASTSERNASIRYEVDPKVHYQTIDNFGASDAWSCQFIGNWPEEKRQKIADLLFSTRLTDEGNPEGIGLSLWRYNLGAGSAAQGAHSGISDEWRRGESFLQADGTYDWESMKGQVWFAKAAKARGVEDLLIFCNSPHVNFTKNGKAYSDSGEASNLPAENFTAFADYLVNSVKGLNTLGLQVDMISPVNEPQWDWKDGGQEGTPFWNEEIAEMVRLLNQKITEAGLEVAIDVAEAGQLNFIYEEHNKPGRASQVREFFHPQSAHYLGDLSHVSQTISGHSYFTTSPASQLIEVRKQVKNAKADLKFWMSEYCILGDNDGEIAGNGRDLGIDPALYIAKVIHSDLTVADASAWHWWLAISPYDYKDGLIYTDKNKEDGNFYESKMLWALGNYSRFIRPGFVRLGVNTSAPETSGLLVSAYQNPANSQLVVVVVNESAEGHEINFNTGDSSLTPTAMYETSALKNLSRVSLWDGSDVVIPARSVMTLIF